MEKKTKLTITLALAVLVITLSLGTAISIAPNESGAQIAAPIQPEIEASQVKEISIQSSNLATTSGEFRIVGGRTIYSATAPQPKILVTITHVGALPPSNQLKVRGFGIASNDFSWGNSYTFCGQPHEITVEPASSGQVTGYYHITVVS